MQASYKFNTTVPLDVWDSRKFVRRIRRWYYGIPWKRRVARFAKKSSARMMQPAATCTGFRSPGNRLVVAGAYPLAKRQGFKPFRATIFSRAGAPGNTIRSAMRFRLCWPGSSPKLSMMFSSGRGFCARSSGLGRDVLCWKRGRHVCRPYGEGAAVRSARARRCWFWFFWGGGECGRGRRRS